MDKNSLTRRDALRSTLVYAGAAVWTRHSARSFGFTSANARPRVAAIGTGSRWCQQATGVDGPHGSAPNFRKYGDYIAVCDADAARVARAKEIVKGWTGTVPETVEDYRAIIDRDDVDIIHISTPDHWHAKIAIEAILSGKDVYCEKPMTLTIDEGRQICDVTRRTGRIVQIGTQQRSSEQFIKAVAMIRAGRIGDVKEVTCSVGGGPTSPQLPAVSVPGNFNWDLWQGPAVSKPFRYLAGPNGETKSWSRSHYEFRWWYEYSGGKLTDWGAHHVDIATWGIDKTDTGPVTVTPEMVRHPVEFREGHPTQEDQYNTATEFLIRATFADGINLIIRHDGDNGIVFEGSAGRIFVNRGRLTGRPVEDLAQNPLPDGALEKVYKDRPLTNHFRNFFESARDRSEPVSDVFSHHRALSTCHLAGIAARLDRKIQWDPVKEQITDDKQAQSFVARDSRKRFETEV
ncbi:MAG: Gfo/Idh/MocA family oxidoreductase [Fuerstiella sp.]|nr:Gfo/Idh/MocA family oxidoreductase [Fuerstiella sp.]